MRKRNADRRFSKGGKAIEQNVQTKPTAVEIVNYKTGIFKDGVPIPNEEAEAGKNARIRFLQNVARAIKISQLERKANEEKLSNTEKFQLIKLDREFDYFEVVSTLERVEKERGQHTEEKEPLSNTWRESSSDPSDVGEKKEGFKGKIKTGGVSEGREKQLKAILIKHKKAVGWSEEEFRRQQQKEAGRKGGLKGKGGRPRKYHTPLERKKAKAEGQRRRAKEARKRT